MVLSCYSWRLTASAGFHGIKKTSMKSLEWCELWVNNSFLFWMGWSFNVLVKGLVFISSHSGFMIACHWFAFSQVCKWICLCFHDSSLFSDCSLLSLSLSSSSPLSLLSLFSLSLVSLYLSPLSLAPLSLLLSSSLSLFSPLVRSRFLSSLFISLSLLSLFFSSRALFSLSFSSLALSLVLSLL